MKGLASTFPLARINRAVGAALGLALTLAAALPCAAATLTVTSTDDDGDADTLRATLDGDTIDIKATGTICLTNGQLVVDKSVQIGTGHIKPN